MPAADENSELGLLLVPELFCAPGGIARTSRHHLGALARAIPRLELAVVALNDKAIDPEALAAWGAQDAIVVACGGSKRKCVAALWRLTAGRSCRVFANHVHFAPLLWLLRIVRPRMRYSVGIHGIEVWQRLPLLQRLGLARAQVIHSSSRHTINRLLGFHPDLAGKAAVLHCALDPSFPIADHSRETVPGRILVITRLAAHDRAKGVDHVIAALPGVLTNHPEVSLHIVGDGVDRARLEALAAGSTAKESIRFLGRVTEEQLQHELAACAIFALPSNKEGFGIVFVEAMAHAKPCVAAAAGGVPEVLDGASGLLVPYGDVPALVAALDEALSRQWDAEAVLNRARHFSFEEFCRRRNVLFESHFAPTT